MRKLFLVMEYASNGSLHAVLQQHQKLQQPIDEATVWRYFVQLLLGSVQYVAGNTYACRVRYDRCAHARFDRWHKRLGVRLPGTRLPCALH